MNPHVYHFVYWLDQPIPAAATLGAGQSSFEALWQEIL